MVASGNSRRRTIALGGRGGGFGAATVLTLRAEVIVDDVDDPSFAVVAATTKTSHSKATVPSRKVATKMD
jgi:hypothetical protein